MNATDPYDLSETEPHSKVWPYLETHFRPMRAALIASVLVTVLAASVEVWLIQYVGKIIDKMVASTPSEFWKEEGLAVMGAASMIIFFRPFVQFLRLAVNDISVLCNIANLVRWRAYVHLIRQSVGWFKEDLSGRTSGRLVDIGNYVGEIIYKAINAVGFGLVYMVGVVVLMAGTEIWLALPLVLWLGLYIGILVWVIPRMVDAQQEFQSPKSALIATVVDGLSNFDALKLIAPRDQITTEQRHRLEDTFQTLFITRQISVALWTVLIGL